MGERNERGEVETTFPRKKGVGPLLYAAAGKMPVKIRQHRTLEQRAPQASPEAKGH